MGVTPRHAQNIAGDDVGSTRRIFLPTGCRPTIVPLLNMRRTATVDLELRGQKIRKGDELLLMYAAANRDERVFQDPQRFDITRHPNPHLAFGIGTHFCMGANIARMELRCMFEAILTRLPRLERSESGPLQISAPAFASGLRSLPVRVATT